MIALEAKKLTIEYDTANGSKRPICGLDCSVVRGELLFVIGANGTGKSSLLRTLAGIQTPSEGKILWSERELKKIPISERPKVVAYMFSQYQRVEGMTVYDTVMLGRYPYTSSFGKATHRDHEMVDASLNTVGLNGWGERMISSLSDGEFKKTLLAKLLAQDCPVMILDEPTTHLDLPSELNFIKMLKKTSRDHDKTIVLSTHNLQAALKFGDRILILSENEKYELGKPEEISNGEIMCHLLKSNELAIENGNLIYELRNE